MNSRRSFIRQASAGLLGLNQLTAAASGLLSWRKELAGITHDETLFRLIRRSLLLPEDLIYFNTGSLGPSPRQIVDLVSSLMHELESNPVVNNWGPLGQRMEAVRQQVADFVGATAGEIILTRNTTEGINLIGSCLQLQPGDEILTTDHEHGGGENGLLYLAETRGAIVRRIDLPLPAESPEQIVSLITQQLSDRTRVLMLSHISTITGLRMPLAEIAAITRPRDILLIADGAQAPGQIAVNVQELGVDAYVSSGHKWLLGPKETGFLYLRQGIQERIRPVFTRGSNQAYSAASGTRNVATIIGLGETLDWHRTIGPERIEARCQTLAKYCRQLLTGHKGLKVISPADPGLSTAMVSIQLEKASNREVFEQLQRQNIVVKVLPKYNALRFSCHMFNTKSEIGQLAEALDRLLAE